MATGTRLQIRKSGKSLDSLDTPTSRRFSRQEQFESPELRPLSVLGQIYANQSSSSNLNMEKGDPNTDIYLGARSKFTKPTPLLLRSPQYESSINLQDSRRSLSWDDYEVHEHGSDDVFDNGSHTFNEILSLRPVIFEIEARLNKGEECSSELLKKFTKKLQHATDTINNMYGNISDHEVLASTNNLIKNINKCHELIQKHDSKGSRSSSTLTPANTVISQNSNKEKEAVGPKSVTGISAEELASMFDSRLERFQLSTNTQIANCITASENRIIENVLNTVSNEYNGIGVRCIEAKNKLSKSIGVLQERDRVNEERWQATNDRFRTITHEVRLLTTMRDSIKVNNQATDTSSKNFQNQNSIHENDVQDFSSNPQQLHVQQPGTHRNLFESHQQMLQSQQYEEHQPQQFQDYHSKHSRPEVGHFHSESQYRSNQVPPYQEYYSNPEQQSDHQHQAYSHRDHQRYQFRNPNQYQDIPLNHTNPQIRNSRFDSRQDPQMGLNESNSNNLRTKERDGDRASVASHYSVSSTRESRIIRKIDSVGRELRDIVNNDPANLDSIGAVVAVATYDLPRVQELAKQIENLEATAIDKDIDDQTYEYIDSLITSIRIWKLKLTEKRKEFHLHLSSEKNLLKNIELPKFTGSAYEQTVYSFLSTFFRFAGKSCSPADQATLLYNTYLSDTIKLEVESIQNDIDKMKQYLIDNYGDLRDIAESRLHALSQLRHPSSNANSKIEYYKKIDQTLKQVESLSDSNYVNSSEIGAVIFSAGFVKQIVSHLPDYVINEFTKRIHKETIIKGKPDGKTHFVILKDIIEMTWKTMNMRSNIKTFREPPNISRGRAMHVESGIVDSDEISTDSEESDEADMIETINYGSSAQKFHFPCPIHINKHELGECKVFFDKTNQERKLLCTKHKLCWTCLQAKCFKASLKEKTCVALSALPAGFACKDCSSTRPFNILTCSNTSHSKPTIKEAENIIRTHLKVFKTECLELVMAKQSMNLVITHTADDTNILEETSAHTASAAINTNAMRPKSKSRARDDSLVPAFDTMKGKIEDLKGVIKEPSTDSVYIYQLLKIGQSEALCFYDNGASTNLVRGEFAEQNGFKVIDQENQRISGVANMGMWCGYGIYSASIGQDKNGDYWQLTFQGINNITNSVPEYSWESVNRETKQNGKISRHEILPPSIGGRPVDIIIGVKNPELVPVLEHVLPSGLGLYRCPFTDIHGSSLAYAGSHDIISNVNQSVGSVTINKTAVMLLKQETYLGFPLFDDKDVLPFKPLAVPLSNFQSKHYETTPLCDDNLNYGKKFNSSQSNGMLAPICSCYPSHNCFKTETYKAKVPLSELRKLIEPDEPIVNYRCEICEQCIKCKSSPSLRSSSIRERMETKLIEESVRLDYLNQKVIVKLPFTQNPMKFLPKYFKDKSSNYSQALAVYRQQCRKKPEMKDKMISAMKELIHLGYLKPLNKASTTIIDVVEKSTLQHYHVWRPVFKESMSTPTRLIVDPSSTMLNLCLAKANAGLNSMLSIILRFRSSSEAWSADIKKLYNQLKLDEHSIPYSLLLFNESMSESEPPETYYMSSAWYGVISTGSQASVAIQRAGNDHKDSHPLGSDSLVNDIYVDDLNGTQQSTAVCRKQVDEAQQILSHIGMELKYVAYSKSPPPPQASKDGVSMTVLGMLWKPEADTISLNLPEINFNKKIRGSKPANKEPVTNANEIKELCDTLKSMTRADVVSKIGEFYDNTGWAEPIKAHYKRAAARLNNLKFEDEISTTERKFWTETFQTWPDLAKIAIPRSTVPNDAKVPYKVRIITCSDSSDQCGGACVYLCFERESGEFSCQLLTAKSELLHMSVPRNELHSLLIAAEITYAVVVSLKINISEILIITDSLVALCWLMNDKSRNKMYVQNQIITIHRYIKWMEERLGSEVNIQIAHISGHQNPADLLTKGTPSPATINESSIWIQGYPWMNLETNSMPITRFSDISLNKDQADQYLNEVILADPDSITVDTEDPTYHLYKSHDDSLSIHCVLPARRNDSIDDIDAISKAHMTHKATGKQFIDFIHLGWLKALRILSKWNTFLVNLFHKTHLKTKNRVLKISMTLRCKLCNLNFYTMHQLDNPMVMFQSEESTDLIPIDHQVIDKGIGYPVESDVFSDSNEVGSEIASISTFASGREASSQIDCVTPVVPYDSWVSISNTETIVSRMSNIFLDKTTSIECLKNIPKKDMKYYTLNNDILFYNGRLSNDQRISVHDLDMLDLKFLDSLDIRFHSPCIWPSSDIFYSYCVYVHTNLVIHGGVEATIQEICKRFYPINCRKIVATIINSCIKCKIIRKKALDQAMKNHSSIKLSFAPAFSLIMIDLAQHFNCKARHEGRQTVKIPALIVCCIVTGATAVYALENWATQSIVMAISRHGDRYGTPNTIFVDPGAALKKLKDVSFNMTDMTLKLHEQNKFNVIVSVAKGHYMQGKVERKIATVRDLLAKLGKSNAILSFLEWETLFSKISNHINSLPICRSSGRSVFSPEYTVITPNRLLLGYNNQRSLSGPLILESSPSNMLQKINEVQETFFNLLSKQLHLLIPKPKFHKDSEVFVGDIILFYVDESFFHKRTQPWLYGLVTKIEGVKLTVEYTTGKSFSKKYLQRNKREVVRIGKEVELEFNSRNHKESIIKNFC